MTANPLNSQQASDHEYISLIPSGPVPFYNSKVVSKLLNYIKNKDKDFLGGLSKYYNSVGRIHLDIDYYTNNDFLLNATLKEINMRYRFITGDVRYYSIKSIILIWDALISFVQSNHGNNIGFYREHLY